MALNGGSLNSHALNAAAGFVSDTGSATINIEQIVNGLGSATVNVEQLVGSYGTSTTNIVQIVEVHYEGSGTINLVQAVQSTGNPLINIEQVVVDAAAVDFHSRNGYEPRLYIDGQAIENDQIHARINVIFRENEAPQLQFTLIPDRGTQDLAFYRGKSVILNVREGSSITRVFTGKINNPDVMIIDQKIRFNCSLDINQEIEDNVGQDFIDSVGFYNDSVFNKPKRKIDELRDRLTTVPQVMDFNPAGKLTIHDIAPKGSADYTLTNSDVYRDSLDYVFSSQQRYINKIDIKAKFTYQRLHHYQITFNATMGVSSFCNWYLKNYTPMRRDLISNAANGAGWPIKDLSFTDFFAGGYYNCSGLITGGTVGFITTKCDTTSKPSLDESGNQIVNDGKKQYEKVATSCSSTTDNLCLGASWKGSTHFAQNIEREYNLSVTAPQSVAAYGTKVKEESYTLTDKFGAEDWENYTKFDNNAPSGFSKTGTSGSNFWVDAITDNIKFDQAINVLLNRAKSEILKSHRDDKVMFKRSLWTAITLGDTVELDTNRVDAIGKVHSYEHTMDVNTGEAFTKVDLVLSRSTGSATDSTLALPTIDMSTVDPTYPITSISYDATYGVDVNTVSNPSGYYGNFLKTVTGGLEPTNVPVTFVVTIPAIPDNLRKKVVPTNTTSFDVEIPNNTLTVYFPDDNYV